MEKKIKVVKAITVIACIIIFTCTIILAFQFTKIANLRTKEKTLATYKTEIIKQINTYDTANSYYSNNRTEYLENYAREVLGWGLGNDTWYTSNK